MNTANIPALAEIGRITLDRSLLARFYREQDAMRDAYEAAADALRDARRAELASSSDDYFARIRAAAR